CFLRQRMVLGALSVRGQYRKTVHPSVRPNRASIPPAALSTAQESDSRSNVSLAAGFFSSLLDKLNTVVYVMHMKSSLKRATKKAFAALGVEVHRTGTTLPNYGLDNFFPLLRRLGLKPRHIIDVGANHGSWTRCAIRYFPSGAYTLIEPQANLKTHIQDLIDKGHEITWISAGCSNEPGQLQLMLSLRDDRSTFMQENRPGKKIT